MMRQPDRRQMIAGVLATLGVTATVQSRAQSPSEVTIPGKSPMLLHNDYPEDLEMPNEYFDQWVTPVDKFFARQHLPRPDVDLAAFRLKVDGLVSKGLDLTVADLRKLPQRKVAATLECTGNGRGFFRPRVPGIQWGRGAIGNAEWRGPCVADILKACGAKHDAAWVESDGADIGVAETPDFIRSLPMRKALHPATILALDMNGAPLPAIHGAPARLIVPGWDGTSWVKWVERLTVTNQPHQGFFMNPAYRYPKYSRPPGSPPVPAELEVIEGMPVKSAITQPVEEGKFTLGKGPMIISGYAWAGEERVVRVDISTDGGSRWQDASLSPQNLNFAWRLFHLRWNPPQPGYYTLLSRATDSAGRVQPIVAPWNPSGYLYNAIDRVGLMVEKGA